MPVHYSIFGKRIMDKKRTVRIICTILIVVFAVAIGVIAGILYKQRDNEKIAERKLNKTRDFVTEAAEDDTETTLEAAEKKDIMQDLGIAIPNKKIDWDSLTKENGDIYAWIYIPDTQIDYPLLQHGSEDNYYIDHNIDGSKGYPGCLTTQAGYNSRDFMDYNTCIYGHNMKNGSMFHSLHEFSDASFFDGNELVYIFTPQATYVYEIFAAYKFSNVLIPYEYDFSTQKGYKEYLEEVFSIRDMGSHFRDGIRVTEDNHMITLSTCVQPTDYKHRWLVQAVLINDPTLSDEQIYQTLGREP